MTFEELPQRHILRTRVHLTNYVDAGERILQAIRNNQSGYVAIANVHMVMTGYWNNEFQQIINNALLTTPDGMPLVWGLKLFGLQEASRVYGPDLTLHCCTIATRENMPVYFYGSRPETLDKLRQNLLEKFPELNIVGMVAPPFRALSAEEENLEIENIIQSGAKLVFVGLGCPKQEFWMAKHTDKLTAVLLGVGAAFDFHAGTVSQAPRWMMSLGLEWFYRLLQEPRRLWKRYVVNNMAFVVLFLIQFVRVRLRST
ncbi:glycosyl transferase, WecB/TagA/CpsF family [[Leptolyngbya] sp. PCC 7376]|uniref:WecB/TagA/CpsF family glycosyltransferase n=1 Tax=[Leptolyngbya] sp. PCC 7376 TaxID=111781 RepID=UPI00029EEB5F|nr:WecB/TagA/CpsF family glycosyltransferase [[Leptolyngbya] sp. PCC 7376]AFY36998.1 glycosyl transferase, WecB/TagA/CpsF family [[Leptolyngbya] sp. PCC 7376]